MRGLPGRLIPALVFTMVLSAASTNPCSTSDSGSVTLSLMDFVGADGFIGELSIPGPINVREFWGSGFSLGMSGDFVVVQVDGMISIVRGPGTSGINVMRIVSGYLST
ncbi:uncharacterized protein EDB91DRAFT_1141256 [Suillus paluster]|uniref:uncharacterized protein n=1 Tax=Suillus paluster TaxID=48578 RepID=UPI001B86B4BA|nr:uncharacterized protein EDB91DRAFT_1141256 [Suillus paluster]KAG1736839.1 hypothetical protein EDB91DRAFT_1141256 [Suillus paluster]